MKKIIAGIITICMLFSALPAFAASDAAGLSYSKDSINGEIVFDSPETEGEWFKSNYGGLDHMWANKKDARATYKTEGIKAGNYELYYWLIPHNFDAKELTLNICHNGKESIAKLPSKLDSGEETVSGWVLLGVYDFKGEGDEKVYLTCPGANVRATKVRLVKTDKEVTAVAAPEKTEGKKEENAEAGNAGASLDAKPSGVCEWEGSWAFSTATPGPLKSTPEHMWIAGCGEEAYVTYKPMIEAVGDVRISVFQLYWHENQTNDIKYEVFHNGKVEEFHLNPLDIDKSQWITLGTFDFAGKPEEEYLKLSCVKNDNPKANTRASTVMFEILNERGGTAWQAVYVQPCRDAEIETANALKQLAQLNKFSDMKDHWASYDVEYMANEGLIAGKGEGAFDPDANITRAEYLTILDRAMGYELVTGETYADVLADSWYATYIATAKANGLLEGLPVSEGFKPDTPITREDMALFTYNAIKATKKNDEWVAKLPTDFAKFTDTAEISDYAKQALEYLVQTGIIKGMTDTTVAPKGNATRAQGAVILKRFMQLFVWAGPPTDEEWVLTFNDEFLGDSVNWGVWKSANGPEGHILSSRWPENAIVKDGAVHLEVRKESRGGQEWTAGSISVRPDVFSQSYGYWEARYKFTESTGVNNSFWMAGGGVEIDVCEGHYPNKANTNYHVWAGEHTANSKQEKSEYDLSKDYHTYGLEWNETELLYYMDGKLIASKPHELAHTPLFPYLSSAVLSWAGAVSDKTDGTAQIVDYVRVWQRPQDVNDPKKTIIGKPVEGATPTTGSAVPSTDEDANFPTVSVEEQKVDNTEYPGEIIIPAEVEGDWKESSFKPNYDGGSHKWSNTKGAASKYPIGDLKKGEYKVYFWRLPHVYNVEQMNFTLHQDGKDTPFGSAALKVPEDSDAKEGWVEIGTLTATGDKDAYFEYICNGTNCRATALKFVPVK